LRTGSFWYGTNKRSEKTDGIEMLAPFLQRDWEELDRMVKAAEKRSRTEK
jgi:hypothetical protein